jgi:hypothetical protein
LEEEPVEEVVPDNQPPLPEGWHYVNFDD